MWVKTAIMLLVLRHTFNEDSSPSTRAHLKARTNKGVKSFLPAGPSRMLVTHVPYCPAEHTKLSKYHSFREIQREGLSSCPFPAEAGSPEVHISFVRGPREGQVGSVLPVNGQHLHRWLYLLCAMVWWQQDGQGLWSSTPILSHKTGRGA